MSSPITRALISVSDKTGLVEFARDLVARGVEILSTGGTSKLLTRSSIVCTPGVSTRRSASPGAGRSPSGRGRGQSSRSTTPSETVLRPARRSR